MMEQLQQKLYRWVARRLEQPSPRYERRIYNNYPNLLKNIRPGDVLLVEGRSELSRIIMLFSQSHWSHSALYVGDALIRKDFPDREKYLEQFGEDARHLLIEAFPSTGVIATPLKKYINDNIRICRPFAIHPEDLQRVIDDVISNLGKHYDSQNIVDVALMLIPIQLNPFRRRSIRACLGNCNDFQVICSGMIARAFQKVGYPIVPALKAETALAESGRNNPYGADLMMRHYTQILPRDFDLSPNFEIIKFNIIADGKFDYKKLPWVTAPAEDCS